MAQIILTEAGAALGQRLLPAGLSVLGQMVSGAAIGGAFGAAAGRAIDQAFLTPRIEGPRLASLHIMESREGAGVPNIYGRMRTGGQVIWAAQFKETRQESGGGKGGPRIETYAYSVSFAVAVCEGPITRVERVWANGEPLALGTLAHRIYPGSETQQPDPLIEAIEGVGQAPAYRGVAYIVFEDLPLEAFGNRLPQLSFEVLKLPPETGTGGLGQHVEAVNIIPASGEFVYATDIVCTRTFPGCEQPINMNTSDGRADFEVSLEQLADELPKVNRAALTVGWFGDDLRAGHCRIRPCVETHDKVTRPWSWRVSGLSRSAVPLVSGAAEGAPNYGGTPADRAVIQGIKAMQARELSVTLAPFLFMDVAAGNGLPDLYGGSEQAAFPWRGRITVSEDGTAAARSEIEAFLGAALPGDFTLDGEDVTYQGDPGDWGFRRFILHHAWLAKAAGGVDAVLLGSEMRRLSQIRDAAGAFPFVEGLVALAADVRGIVGPDTAISYGADWTEYGAYVPSDGLNDVLFPLDPLWASPDVDFVAVDWYPPAGDWRDGEAHLDALAGFGAADDPAYLAAHFSGGEGYDWYYASAADREAQLRTPIIDAAHGEDWVFRVKDIEAWWASAHHERPGGVRSPTPTAWVPGSKPIVFNEIGFPALDKGGNAPNLFYDPKSAESALPPYSSGERDDVFQRRALSAALSHFAEIPSVGPAYVWAWDARPYPAFPRRTDVWTDGDNWAFGHWLNGRTGLTALGLVIEDICERGGVEVSADGVNGLVEGFALDGVMSVRGALEPLRRGFGFHCSEADGVVTFRSNSGVSPVLLTDDDLVAPGAACTEGLLDKLPGRLNLSFASIADEYRPAEVEARDDRGDPRNALRVTLPLAFSPPQAEAVAARLLKEAVAVSSADISAAPAHLTLQPGQRIDLAGEEGIWQVAQRQIGLGCAFSLVPDQGPIAEARTFAGPSAGQPANIAAAPHLLVIDGPSLPGSPDPRPLLAAYADPWPGQVDVEAGFSADAMRKRAELVRPAAIGRLRAPLPPGPVGRWDHAARIEVEMAEPDLASASEDAVRSGANTLLIETEAGWECLSFLSAELIEGSTYRLSGLLRGLQGTDGAAEAGAPADAVCVRLDGALQRGDVRPEEIGADLVWQVRGDNETQTVSFEDRQGLPWPVAHLRARRSGGGLAELGWIRRSAGLATSWSLPEPASDADYEVEWTLAGGTLLVERVTAPPLAVPQDALSVRVREIGLYGRGGDWVSISLASL